MAETESTHQRNTKTSTHCQKKFLKGSNLVRIPNKPVMMKKKIRKSNKTPVKFSKPKSTSCHEIHRKKNRIKGTVQKFMHICGKCGKGFFRRSNLENHNYTHSGQKPHKCYYCERGFTLKSNLVKHVRIHTGEKRFGCNVCGRRFILKKNMIDHTRTHSGEKPYACIQCEQTFTRYNTLVRHLRIHTGEKPYECNECLQRFSVKYYLQRHIISMHLK